MATAKRKIKSVVLQDGEVVEGDALQELLADPARRQEFPDPTPLAPPIGYQPGPSLIDQMRLMVRTELSRQAESQEFETFEDAEDFDVDDDFDPTSPWEEVFEPETQEPPRQGAKVQPGDPVPLTDEPKSGETGDKSPVAKPSEAAPEPPPAKPA